MLHRDIVENVDVSFLRYAGETKSSLGHQSAGGSKVGRVVADYVAHRIVVFDCPSPNYHQNQRPFEMRYSSIFHIIPLDHPFTISFCTLLIKYINFYSF